MRRSNRITFWRRSRFIRIRCSLKCWWQRLSQMKIQDAAGWVRVNNPQDIDYQPWDVSVKAVAHYPTVLAMLNDRLDWTTASDKLTYTNRRMSCWQYSDYATWRIPKAT